MNTLSFNTNNSRTIKLIQRVHDGCVLLVIEDQYGNHESIDDNEAFIPPGDFVMLINHYRECKRTGRPIVRGIDPRDGSQQLHDKISAVAAGLAGLSNQEQED